MKNYRKVDPTKNFPEENISMKDLKITNQNFMSKIKFYEDLIIGNPENEIYLLN